jgi:hypothetical protein
VLFHCALLDSKRLRANPDGCQQNGLDTVKGGPPAVRTLASPQVLSTGVIVATYRSGSEIKCGSFAA